MLCSSASATQLCTRCGASGHLAAVCELPFFRAHCTFCGKVGHKISDCYTKVLADKEDARKARRAEREAARLLALVCFRCGQTGHVKTACVKPLPRVEALARVCKDTTVSSEKETDAQSDTTAATVSDLRLAKARRPPRKGDRFDTARAAAAAAADAAEAALRAARGVDVAAPGARTRGLRFGPAPFTPLRPFNECAASSGADGDDSLRSEVTEMVRASVAGALQMRGQRGEKLVTQMLTDCYSNGLFMHGDASSPLNRLVIPAIRHIFAEMSKLPPMMPKRVDCLTILAHACEDCQQVQAREILRIYGDLTAQNETLEGQLKYSLVRLKEAALNCYISRHHPRCDSDHTQVQPWQQRAHLVSGYVALIGESFGLDGVTAARSDRFLPQVQRGIADARAEAIIKELRAELSAEEWLQMLLSDINNQAEGAERLIDRNCIFKWAQANMSKEKAHLVFYDEERADDFGHQVPTQPTQPNRYQPFLSRKVLLDILTVANMLRSK